MLTSSSGGWREYCYNRVEVDTARPMFRKENDSRMRSSESQAGQGPEMIPIWHRSLSRCAAVQLHASTSRYKASSSLPFTTFPSLLWEPSEPPLAPRNAPVIERVVA